MESRTAESATSWVDRIGLAGIVLMLSVPFLAWHHYYPISSFYSEWLALLCGMGVAVSLLGIRRGDDIILPWLSVGFLGLVLVLGAQIVLETVTHTVRSAAAGEAPNAAPARLPAPPVVLLSGDRSQVTINGQTVRLGGRIGDSKVVRISDTEVVLQSATSTQTIRLYGAIDKKMIATGPQATKGARPGSTEAVK